MKLAARMSHGTRVTVLVSLVLLLTVGCSLGALFTAREMDRVMEEMVSRNLPSVVAAGELQTALLEQRGIVGAFMLDGGHPGWLNDLDLLKPRLARWLEEARKTARTTEELGILDRLEGAYRVYDQERERAIALFQEGETTEARKLLLKDVSLLSAQVQSLGGEFAAANARYMTTALQAGHRQVAQLTLFLAIAVPTIMVLALVLLVMILRDVLLPVRRLALDARAVAKDPAGATGPTFTDELGELEFYSRSLMTDVTRTRERLDESRRRLVAAEKLAAVGKFAACVAHEIRNPLASMKMWLFQLREIGGSEPEIARTCQVLEDEVKRLEAIASDFLRFSRPPEIQREPTDVSSLVTSTLELAQPRLGARRIVVEHVNGAKLPLVMADPNQLKQVLLNLLVNAVEVTPENGRVRVAESLEGNGAGLREVIIRVTDGGPGVCDKIRARLFEPFATTKPHGTGLGLSIASEIVSRHGGRLVLESTSDQGAVFAVHIPVDEEYT